MEQISSNHVMVLLSCSWFYSEMKGIPFEGRGFARALSRAKI
jgi:hypothetical protein